jgi:hypothetical protein
MAGPARENRRRAEEGSRQTRHDGAEQLATRSWAGHRFMVARWGRGDSRSRGGTAGRTH